MSVDQALEWLNDDHDIFDEIENVEVANPADKTSWLVLNGFQLWRAKEGQAEREAWRRLACFVVRKVISKDTLTLMHGLHFQGSGDIPSASSGGLRSYLGEHPWAHRKSECPTNDGWVEDGAPRHQEQRSRSSPHDRRLPSGIIRLRRVRPDEREP